MKILLVDDVPETRKLLGAILEPEGHSIVEASDGAEALEILAREKIDAIISDVVMPRMDGYQLCCEVRASKRYGHLPFIFYTAAATSPGDEKLAFDMGADKYLTKDAPNSALLEALREITTKPRTPPTPSGSVRALNLMKTYHQQLVARLEEKNTELTARNEELVRSEQKLVLQSTALETAANAVFITDTRGIILWVNPALTTLIGYAAEEVIGKTPRLFKSGQHDREYYRDLWTTILAGKTWRGSFINRRKDGSLYQDEHTITPVRSREGEITHFIAIMNDVTERKQAEESAMRLAAIVEFSDDAIIGKDLNGLVTSWNAGAEKVFGYSSAEMVGTSITRLIPPERLAEEERILQRIRRWETVKHFETVRVGKDGRRIDISVTVSPIMNARGQVVGASKVARDITDRKQAAQQLTLLNTCVSNLNDIVLITEAEPIDEPGPRIIFVNEAFGRLTGYTSAETLGQSPRFLQGEKTDRRILTEIRQALAQRQPIRRQIINYGKDGAEYWLDMDIVPIFDGAGKCTHFAAIERDITEAKKNEEQIAEQAALLDKARDAILVRDLEGKILFWNEGAERMYGWTHQEVVGREVGELLYTDPKKFEEVNGLAISLGEWHGELQHLTKNRGEITVEARWTLIRDKEGRPKSVLAINTDITDKKKIEAQFMRAQRMESIGTLAGGIAHDLNNILAPIMMSIDVLKTMSDHPQAKKILETIEVSAKRGSDIVRQVLSFARGLEGARVEIQPKHLLKDLEHIIQDTFPKDIRLQFSIPNDTWTILGDPTQVHQILLNLCVNARDAMPNGGALTIGVENAVIDEQYAAMNLQAKPGRYVKISVTDSGTGIPRDVLDKIFEPFFTTKALNKGTGLGLSTVMAIVKSHEGIINVYSEPGRGTTFRVYLPAMEMSPEARMEQTQQVSLPRGNGETVLVVDDEASILTITSQTLEAFGYRVLTATDGAEAVATYAQHRNEIAVVLTDMAMPVMDGPATVRALMRINPKVKIVAASGLSTNGDAATVSGAGVKHFLTKPYTAGTLLKTLRAILSET